MLDNLFDSIFGNGSEVQQASVKKDQSQDWGPGNPEVGGDGTGGQDTPEILAILKACRTILDMKRNPAIQDNIFERGDLVYDSRTEEHGVVLGEMPNLDFLPSQVSHTMSKRIKEGETRKYLVLTITTDQDTGKKRTRVRYVNRHNLRLIVEKDRNTLSDLDKFCSRQCIQECSSLCSLYKYKRIRGSEE